MEFDSAGSTATKAKSIKGEVQFQTGETSHELSCKITQLVNLDSRFHSVHQNFGSQELHFLTLVVKLFPVSTHQNEPRRQDHGHMLCPDGHPRTKPFGTSRGAFESSLQYADGVAYGTTSTEVCRQVVY